MYTNRPWGIDISGWNIPAPNYKELVNRGASFAFVKGSMGGGIATTAQQQVYELRNAGFKYVGVYHWADPIHRTVDAQLQHIDRIIKATKPDMIAVDNEQWWASWAAFWQFQRGDISAAAVPKLHPLHISNFGRKLTRRVKDTFGLPTINYTANWFISTWSPQMRTWINEFDLWYALYPLGYARWQSWNEVYAVVNTAVSTLPSGATNWKFWQITDKKIFPGFSRVVSLNIYNGSHEDLERWIGKTGGEIPVVPPVPEPYFEVYQNRRAWLGMNVRDAPNGKRIGERVGPNQTFNVYEKIVLPPHTWGKINATEDMWVALSWSDRIS